MKKKRILSLVLIYAILASILLTNDILEVSAAQTFKDVKTSDWFYKDVMYAKQTGFMKGYSDNTFRPQNTMDVSTFVQLLMKAANVEYSASAHSWMISESRATKTTPKHIVMALYKNIIKAGEFKDYQKAITRGEMCQLINRVLELSKKDAPFKDLDASFFEDKVKIASQIKDYAKMNATTKDIAYIVYASGIVHLKNDGTMGLSKKATRAEITSALIRLANPYYRIVPTVPTTTKNMSNTVTVEEFTTQLLKAVGKFSTSNWMNLANYKEFVRPEADYPSYQKPILRREAAMIVARLMDDITDIERLFTRGGNEVSLKGIPTASTYPDIEEIFVYPSPIWTVYDWEGYRGNISDIYQITEEYQKEMVTLYLAGFMDVDKNNELRPYDFLTKKEATVLIDNVKQFSSLNPRQAQDKLLTMIRDVKEKAMPSMRKPSNAKLWGETYPYVDASLYEYVKEINKSSSNIQLYKKREDYIDRLINNNLSISDLLYYDTLSRDPQVYKNYLNTRYTVDYHTLNSKADYYSTANAKGGNGDFLKRVLFFYNSASIMNVVQPNNEDTPIKDRLFPDDIIKKEIADIKKYNIVMQSEAVTHKSLLYGDYILVTLRTIYYPGTSEDYLKSKGLEVGVWYEQDLRISMIITCDGPEEYRDRWVTSYLVDPHIDKLSTIRKMK
ncbi:MAG TPA: hypothetical protein DHW61_02100 [Lachnoclostridium phytofermentans]|uniref:SLH domain-containing protein n=1 Tax=Lachnoclostridium phytofermentans TaxID=66219 RepID=A0A3D2X220_9FIRM|nr:S-layer homology domain-containing protein [Lachnoclostridium sp.]HCL01199.1 hypothetical protein [Lachnoclostridium phytofermentans]